MKTRIVDVDRYGSDYDAVSAIKTIADRYGVSVLIIHHTKKAKDEDDWLNEVSGTQGLAGAADTLLFLKRGRCQNIGMLRVTGRDVEEAELAMTLTGFGWRLEGDADTFSLNKDQTAIIDHLKQAGMQTSKEISECLGINVNTIKSRLRKLQGDGRVSGYGGKWWIESK
ncbi:hypothetical protein AGMMS49957_13240 [Synergistales bacterium]|nr:hypothetical protein AGMMS49957_13240 [Synergistales bacterium]